MKILILCALLGTMAHCKPGGYFRQEYQFKKSSSTFKNNELQTKDDDQGFYHKQGDLEGPADVNQHNQQSQYVSPTLGGIGQTVTSYDNRDLTNEAESAFANHGMGHGPMNSGMNTGMGGMNTGAGGGRSYSSYSSYSSYGTTSNGQMSQANMQQLKQNLQQEMTDCLQEAMAQYRKEAARSSYTVSDSSRVHLLESELKSNLTRLLQAALYKNHGPNLKPGSITYTVTATGVYNPQNDINQDLTDIRNQLEQQFLKELRKEVQTVRSESTSHSQSSRTYGSTGQTYYDSAEIEDLNRRPNRYTVNNGRDYSLSNNQQSTKSVSYASALNSGRGSKPNYNTHTNTHYEPIHVTINPNVRLTDVMQNIQNNAHRQITAALRTFEEKYTKSSYRLTNSRPTYETALNDFKEQLRYNLTDQIQRELEKNYGVQTNLQGYSFSLNAGNTANYKLEDFDELKKTMENNLNTFLENTLRQQETRYQQQVTTTNFQNRDYTHHGPQFTQSLTASSQTKNPRYQPSVYVPSSQSQSSYGSNYQTTSQSHNNVELEEMTRRLQSELSRQLQTAIEDQKRVHTSNYQAQNSQVLYQELEDELKRNITRQLQESLNKNYGNQGNRGGYSYTISSGVYNPNANYQTQDLDAMMKRMQVDLERQLREQMSSSSYKQGNYVVVSSGPYVVPNNADTGLYTSSSYPMKVQSPTKSFNKYQQFSSYSHSASDMNGEDCANGGHDHGNYHRIRRHAGDYHQGFEQHQHPLQYHHHNPQFYHAQHHSHTLRQPDYYPNHFNGYHPQHGPENEELGQQLEDLDSLEPSPVSFRFRQPAYYSHHTNNYQHHAYNNQHEDLDNLGQHPEIPNSFHFRQPAHVSHYSNGYQSQHHAYNGPENEELGQQLEDLDKLGQQPEDIDNLGQQVEDLGQQIEDLNGLSQQPQGEEDYFDLAPETSKTPNEPLILNVKPAAQTSPLTPKPQRLAKPNDYFEEVGQQLEEEDNLGQQLEELGQQMEDFDGQQAQGEEDYFVLVPSKPKSTEQPIRTLPKREPAVVNSPLNKKPLYSPKSSDDLTQQVDEYGGQKIEDLGQQLEDFDDQIADDGFEKLQTGKPQSANFNSGNPGWHRRDPVDRTPPKHDEDLRDPIEEVGQQLEDLDSLGQQPESFGNLGQQLEDLDDLTQQSEDHYGNLETGRNWGHLTQQSEDDFAKLETLNLHANPVYVRPSTPKPKNAGKNIEDFQHTEDIVNVNKPTYVPYRGLNLPRPTTKKPITTSIRDEQGSYDDFHHIEDIYTNAHHSEDNIYSHKPNSHVFVNANNPKVEDNNNGRSAYVPYRHLPRPNTPKPNNLNHHTPSYVPYSGLNLPRPSSTPKPITSASLYHPDDDTQQITQDIFGHTKPHSTSDDFVDHGDYLQYVGDRKDITHMESMDQIYQRVPLEQVSQQQEDIYEPPRQAISVSEANRMHIGRNRDTPRDLHYVRNEQTGPSRNPESQHRPFQYSDLALHRREDAEDLTQQSEDLGQQLEDLDLTQQPEHFGDLTQQSEDLTQQMQDLTQQLEDLTQQTEDLNVEQQHANVNFEPLRPLHTATINHPPRTELHPGNRRVPEPQTPASFYGRSLSQQHRISEDEQHMPNSEVTSFGRTMDVHKSESFEAEESTTEEVNVETAPTKPTGFWKSFGGKVSSSFSSVKQKAVNLMG